MSDSDPDGPRRGFDPVDEPDDGVAGRGSDPGATPSEPEPQRDWVPAEGDVDQPQAPAEPPVGTPIPPPAATLPEGVQPAAAGRRFSAEERTEDWVTAAPRRSAASVSSPPAADADSDADPTTEPPAGPPTVGGAAATGFGDRHRLLALLAGVVVLAVLVGLGVWFGGRHSEGSGTPGAEPSVGASQSPSASAPAPGPDEAQLLTASELGKLRASTTWTQDGTASATPSVAASTTTGATASGTPSAAASTTTSASPSGPAQPACVEFGTTGAAQAELSRTFTANKASGALKQYVQAWPDAATAGTVYEDLLAQAGGCEDSLLRGAYRLDTLSDAAASLTVKLTDDTSHTLLIARTGRFVNLVDASLDGDTGIGVTALASAVVPSLGRQCEPAGGTCPDTPKVVATVPPPTQDAGWLAWVDLPLVSNGAGSWTATDPGSPSLVGSQCEDVDLNKLPGSTSSAHRTYLLTDDPDAPQSFGVDQAVYTFAKSSQASAMVKKLTANFNDCGDRTRTATVKDAAVTAAGPDGEELTGTSFTVTQRISNSTTVTFRVGIAAVGERMVYLLANPSGTFDFTDEAWRAVVGRAAQRVTQSA